MFRTRSVRVWLICGVFAFCFEASDKAQDAGQPQGTTGASGSGPQGQEKCCASATHDAKASGEQAAPKLSSVDLFAARARIVLGSGQPAKGDWGLLIADGGTGQVLFEESADKSFV